MLLNLLLEYIQTIPHREIVTMQTDISVLPKPLFARERRRHPRFVIDLPLEYRKVGEANSRGAYTGDVSRMGLLIHSIDDLLTRTELEISIFYANEYRFDIFTVFARIVWKQVHSERKWKGYRYGLEVVRISAENRRKLDTIIAQQVVFGEGSPAELNMILNSGPSRPGLILAQRRVEQGGFKKALIQFVERHFEEIVFAIILLAILMAT